MNRKEGNKAAGDTTRTIENSESDSSDCNDDEEYIPSYDKYNLEYCMKSPQKSLCYIFNHTKYSEHLNLKPRKGALQDCAALYLCFTRLQFEVHSCTDFSVSRIMNTLDSVRQEDHTNRAAFVCIILSHGDHNYVYAEDGKYNVKEVQKYFYGNKCPSLVGKPKLFFIQACRGKKLDPGNTVQSKESMDSDSSGLFKLPNQADLLIAHSTIIGYRAFRSAKGSKFIIILCECLNEYAKDMDLLEILTIVNRRLALFESNCPRRPAQHAKKQMPCIWFTLTKKLKFLSLGSE